jgi:hypothetical protein
VPENTANVPPAAFAAAREAILNAAHRPELLVTEIEAPSGIAPWSVALSADVSPTPHGADSDLGTGRFILLYDPVAQDAWGGHFRVVCFAQAPLETELGIDPMLADVAWSWLIDALETRAAAYSAASGTATKTLSTGFGALATQGDVAQVELRASWTPGPDNLLPHVDAWGDLVCMLAGLPPAPDGVHLLAARRVARG